MTTQHAMQSKVSSFFFWPIVASLVNIAINLTTLVTEGDFDDEHLHLPAILVSLVTVGVILLAQRIAARGQLIRGLGIMSVVVAIDSAFGAYATTYGGIVSMLAPLLVFMLTLRVIHTKTARRLAFVNAFFSIIVAVIVIIHALSDEADNTFTVALLIIGVIILMSAIFYVLMQHQFFITKTISELQTSNHARGEMAKQLKLQSEKLQERSSRLETLNDVTQNAMRQLSMDDMLPYIMRRAADLVQATHSSILLQDRGGENLIFHYGSGFFRTMRGQRFTKFDHNLAVQVWQSGQLEYANDCDSVDSCAASMKQFGITAIIASPLIHNKQTVGVMVFTHNQNGKTFSDEQITLINQLSQLASLAYGNSVLYAQVQTERDKARRVMKTMGQGMALVNKNGNINYANPALSSLLGYEIDELNGKPFDNLFAEEKWSEQPLYQRTHDAQAFSGQYLLCHKDGSHVAALISYPPQMVEGSLDETVCVFTDLTQIKAFQDKMKEARDQALHMVELKTSFLATVSHELRTPLHSIEGYLELLLDTPLDEEQNSYAKTAFDASVNLNDIINEVLDFSKLDSKAMQLQLAAGSVKTVVENVVATLNSKAMQKNLFLNLDVSSQVPSQLMIDSQRLRQILINLAGNAIKFTQQGGVQIRVQPQAISDGAITLLFSVIDTGVGISKNDQQRIFQPFMQADNTATRAFGGTGLGLAIVKSLVELMGGEVGVQSEVGNGSRFWFTIVSPVAKIQAPSTQTQEMALIT
ncbi:MAG: ATP-binding protein [Anaerolineae bacterium]|nr:ATP-binding protein [Anaerolineae bacterium]